MRSGELLIMVEMIIIIKITMEEYSCWWYFSGHYAILGWAYGYRLICIYRCGCVDWVLVGCAFPISS
jgi:hypothetical protein